MHSRGKAIENKIIFTSIFFKSILSIFYEKYFNNMQLGMNYSIQIIRIIDGFKNTKFNLDEKLIF